MFCSPVRSTAFRTLSFIIIYVCTLQAPQQAKSRGALHRQTGRQVDRSQSPVPSSDSPSYPRLGRRFDLHYIHVRQSPLSGGIIIFIFPPCSYHRSIASLKTSQQASQPTSHQHSANPLHMYMSRFSHYLTFHRQDKTSRHRQSVGAGVGVEETTSI